MKHELIREGRTAGWCTCKRWSIQNASYELVEVNYLLHVHLTPNQQFILVGMRR